MPVRSNPNPNFREEVQHLIDSGHIADALLLMFEAGYYEAITLKAQLDSAMAQFENQIIGLAAWKNTQNRINQALLQLLDTPNSTSATDDCKPPVAEKDVAAFEPIPPGSGKRKPQSWLTRILKLFG